MDSRIKFLLPSLCALSTLILAGCQGVSNSTPSTTTTYQLTVAGAAANTGTITSQPTGISCPSTCNYNFAQNTIVTLTATPASNYTFGGWSGACSGSTLTCQVTVSAATSVSATFTAVVVPTFSVTVTTAGTGTGTVTSNTGGISCTSGSTAGCSANFPQGTQVVLTATPAANSTFNGWSGAACSGSALTCQVTVTAATSVSATFTAVVVPTFSVTVTTAGTGTGTVTSNTGGISCTSGSTAGCSASFAQNAQVVLTATPETSNTFNGWTAGPCSGTGTCTLTVTAATTVTATFGPPGPFSALNHIILFADENRSLDHYFGYMRQYWANNSIADQGFDGLPQFNPVQAAGVQPPYYGAAPSVPGCDPSNDVASCSPVITNQITSFSFHALVLPSGTVGTVCEENQSPFWNEAHNDWDYTNPADQPAEVGLTGAPDPPLNGFVFTAAYDARSNAMMDVNGVRGMGYFQDADLNFYYALATDFGTSDRFFSPVMDRTQLNRAYIYAATSQGYAYPPGGGNLKYDANAFTATTIFEALENAGITWKIYIDPQNVTYKGTNCQTAAAGQPQDLCLAGASYMNMFTYETTVQNSPTLWQHFVPISQFAIDLQDDAAFPQFAYIEPASSAGLDEHPSDTDFSPVNVQLGAQYVQKYIVGPFLTSAIWSDSAMIFTYDEAGGLYDHVSPQPVPPPYASGNPWNDPIDLVAGINGTGGDICTNPGQVLGQGTCTFGWTGYRIPLVVISPYAKKNFVSHTVRDTTAVLAMVEARFLASTPLTDRDAYYLPGTTTDYSMDEFFDFTSPAWATPPTFAPQTVYSTQAPNNHCDQTPAASWNEPPLVTAQIVGGGSVSSSPAFVQGFEPCTTWCTVPVTAASTVTLTATPNTGSIFTGWSGACTGTTPTCTLTAAGQQFATATFNP